MRFFTSDIHFGDKPTLWTDLRPFKNEKQFDKFIIKKWNKLAKKGDVVYVVGDMIDCDGAGFDSWKRTIHYVKKIKADIVLIIGNNEQRVIDNYFNGNFEAFRTLCLELGFKEVCQDMTIEVAGEKFFLTHKPSDCKKDMLNLFGHLHSSGGIYRPFGFNVGCDGHYFLPFSEEEIKILLRNKEKFWDKDEEYEF